MSFNRAVDYKGLHLFCNPYSNCAERVMLAVAEKGLNVTLHEVDLMKGEQLTPEYRAINPSCDVPALVHDGVPMGDSISILRYLERQFPESSLVPANESEAAEMEQLLDNAAQSHMEGVVPWIYARGYGRLPTEEQKAFYDRHVPHRSQFHNDRIAGRTAGDVKQAQAVLDGHFGHLDSLLAQRHFLTGDSYSLADIAWFPNAFLLQNVFGFSLKRYPNLRRWMAEIESRPAFQSGVKAHLKPVPGWLIRLMLMIVRRTGNRR